MADQPLAVDNALAAARDALRRAPLIDGHNDLAWVIRIDQAARGDVVAYDLTKVHERADTDIPRLREGMVGAQFWAAFQPTSAPHPARTASSPAETSCPRPPGSRPLFPPPPAGP